MVNHIGALLRKNCVPFCDLEFRGFKTVVGTISVESSNFRKVHVYDVESTVNLIISNNGKLLEFTLPDLATLGGASRISVSNNSVLAVLEMDLLERFDAFTLDNNPKLDGIEIGVKSGNTLELSKLRMTRFYAPLLEKVKKITFEACNLPDIVDFPVLKAIEHISFERCVTACTISMDKVEQMVEFHMNENTFVECSKARPPIVSLKSAVMISSLSVYSNLGLQLVRFPYLVSSVSISVSDNFSLRRIQFHYLQRVSQISVQRNPHLKSLDLTSLTNVFHYAFFTHLFTFQNLTCPSLRTVGLIAMQWNFVLKEVSFPELIDASIIFTENGDIESLTIPKMVRSNRFVVSNNTRLKEIILPSLSTIYYTNIYHNFINSGSVGTSGIFGDFKYQKSLFDPIPDRELSKASFNEYMLNGNMHIRNNPSLKNCSLPLLSILHGDLVVSNNSALTHLVLPNLVGSSMIFVNNNPSLVMLETHQLQTVDSLVLPLSSDLAKSQSCATEKNIFTGDGFVCTDENNDPISPKISIFNCPKLTSVTFPRLLIIRDMVEVSNNANLKHLTFPRLFSLRLGIFRNNSFPGTAKQICKSIFPGLIPRFSLGRMYCESRDQARLSRKLAVKGSMPQSIALLQ